MRVIAIVLASALLAAGVYLLRFQREGTYVEKELSIQEKANPTASQNEAKSGKFDKLESNLEEVETDWLKQVEDLFINKFGLDKMAVEQYKSLREAYEEDLYKAEKDFHEYMAKKFGPDYEYKATDDQEAYRESVLEKYEEQMKQLLGEKNYVEYLKLKDHYNEKMMEKSEDEDAFFIDI